jgi:hypothetical protein
MSIIGDELGWDDPEELDEARPSMPWRNSHPRNPGLRPAPTRYSVEDIAMRLARAKQRTPAVALAMQDARRRATPDE